MRLSALFALAVAGFVVALAATAPSDATPPVLSGKVTRVVDGDTLVVSARRRAVGVRILGVSAPERGRCYAKAATAETRRLSLGKAVRLLADPSRAARDGSGRLLTYVLTPKGDLGTLLLKGGFARVHKNDGKPFRRLSAYLRAERVARAAGKGLWSACSAQRPADTPVPPLTATTPTTTATTPTTDTSSATTAPAPTTTPAPTTAPASTTTPAPTTTTTSTCGQGPRSYRYSVVTQTFHSGAASVTVTINRLPSYPAAGDHAVAYVGVQYGVTPDGCSAVGWLQAGIWRGASTTGPDVGSAFLYAEWQTSTGYQLFRLSNVSVPSTHVFTLGGTDRTWWIQVDGRTITTVQLDQQPDMFGTAAEVFSTDGVAWPSYDWTFSNASPAFAHAPTGLLPYDSFTGTGWHTRL